MDPHKALKEIFGPRGLASTAFPDYERRPQQIRMCEETLDALLEGRTLVVEAPTGTGKTLAYLLAAALSRKRTVISTGTKNLQEQLFLKDVPFVQKHFFPGLSAALLKGRGNYVCHNRYIKFQQRPFLPGLNISNFVEHLSEWYGRTCESGEGDRVELEDMPDDDPVWNEICSTRETCVGAKTCKYKDDCFVLKMRKKAADADILVVNHHLLCSDAVVRETGFGEVIPRFEAIIVDEAHGLEDAATMHFGYHLSRYRLMRLVRDAVAELTHTQQPTEKFKPVIEAIEKSALRIFEGFPDIERAQRIIEVSPDMAEARNTLHGNLQALAARIDNLPGLSDELRAIGKRALEIAIEVEYTLDPDPDGAFACWGERRDGNLQLHASPIDVGDHLRKALYARVNSAVFTSATLSSGGEFGYFKARVGLNADVRGLILDSPFDYPDRTMLYVPKSMPEPNDPGFMGAAAETVRDVLGRTRGRAFVLFTSYRNMQGVYDLVKRMSPYPLLLQGQKPKHSLLREFRENPGSVLFATSSFWEGVDVRGDALSCVIVDRLPFAAPSDPVLAARIERLRRKDIEPFKSLQVPMAVIALKQGFGRLIRTGSDKGVLCILDTRIIQKSYGAVFRKSLHESPLTRDITEIDAFFDRWESRISPKPVSSKAEKKNALGRVRSTKRRAAP